MLDQLHREVGAEQPDHLGQLERVHQVVVRKLCKGPDARRHERPTVAFAGIDVVEVTQDDVRAGDHGGEVVCDELDRPIRPRLMPQGRWGQSETDGIGQREAGIGSR